MKDTIVIGNYSITIVVDKRKIKIVRYPYLDHELGEVVDFGVEKNKSLVAMGRAVWVLNDEETEELQEIIKKNTKEQKNSPQSNGNANLTMTDSQPVLDQNSVDEPITEKKDPKLEVKKKTSRKAPKRVTNELQETVQENLDFENDLREKIQKKKDDKKSGFWDNLK